MKPADLNIYCCIIYAVCSRSPAEEPDPEPSRGVSPSVGECEVLGSLPQPTADLWEPSKDLVRPQISLFTCVKWGHLNASCRQGDGAPPVRSVREIGENLISTWFLYLGAIFFLGLQLYSTLYLEKFDNTHRFAFLLCKMGRAPWSGTTWLVTSVGPPRHCFITLIMSASISVSKLRWLLMAKRQRKITLFIIVKTCPLQHKPDGGTLAVVLPGTSPC